MKPARAFFASLSVSLLVLTLSYQAAALPRIFEAPAPPPPASNAWMDNAQAVKAKGNGQDDLSELAPLLDAS